MNTDDLRGALAQGAANQPRPSPDLRSGVDRVAARRQRQRRWLAVGAPAAVFVFLGGAAIGAAQNHPTTLDTVSEPTVTTDAPIEDGTTTTAAAAEDESEPVPVTEPQGEPEGPDDDESGELAAPVGGDCGSVTVDAPEFEQLPDEPTAPLECFARALEADADATLTVVGETPDGVLTAVLTSAPGHQLTMALDGEVAMDLPELPAIVGNWLGDDDDAPAHCDLQFDVSTLGAEALGNLDFEAIGCVVDAVLSGDGGTVTAHVVDDQGGDLALTVNISDGHATLTADGEVTIDVPEGLLPSEILDLIPSDFGIDGSSFGDLDQLGDLSDLGCSDDNADDPPWCD